MTRLVLAATVVLAAFLWLQPAKAEAPWCAVITIGEDSVIWDCRFRTIEECRPTVLAGKTVVSAIPTRILLLRLSRVNAGARESSRSANDTCRLVVSTSV